MRYHQKDETISRLIEIDLPVRAVSLVFQAESDTRKVLTPSETIRVNDVTM